MKDMNAREDAIYQLVVERDKARAILAAAQAQVDDLTASLSESLVEHLETDHNIGVLSIEAGSLRSYHKQAHKMLSCPRDGSALCQGLRPSVLQCERCDYITGM